MVLEERFGDLEGARELLQMQFVSGNLSLRKPVLLGRLRHFHLGLVNCYTANDFFKENEYKCVAFVE